MDVWFENYAKVKVRPSSHQTYRGYIDNHIKPNIGKIPLSELTSLELQKFYKKLLSNGRVERIESKKQSKGLSPKTVRNLHQIIASAMKLAKEQKLIAVDPTDGCALPKVEHKEMKTLPVEQLASFLREAKDSGVFELYYVELATGLRRGELLGLKWEDLDLERGDLRVKRQIARINGEVVEAPLKTKNAYRTLPLAKDTIDVLNQQKKKVGSCPWVFPSPTGGPMSPDSVLHMLHRVLKRAGLPRVRFHDLRHTFATASLEHGMDIKPLSTIIGHVSSTTTLNTYAHITDAMRQNAADKIDRGIGRAEPKPMRESASRKPAPSTFQARKRQRRKPGTGCVSRINDHLWEGRYSPIINGQRMARNVYAKTEAECEMKLAELIREIKEEIAAAKEHRKPDNLAG